MPRSGWKQPPPGIVLAADVPVQQPLFTVVPIQSEANQWGLLECVSANATPVIPAAARLAEVKKKREAVGDSEGKRGRAGQQLLSD